MVNRLLCRAVGLAVLAVVFSRPASGQDDGAAEERRIEESGRSIEKGLSLEAAYILDWSGIAAGGLARKGVARGLFDVTLAVDLEELFGLEGGTFFVEHYTKRGRNGSDDVGDIQGFSNIDGDDVSHFAQYWYEQWMFRDRLRVKAGKVDANTEFAFVDSASNLLNSSAGYSPTILRMPTYPHPALSLNAFLYPSEGLHIGMGLYDGSPDPCSTESESEQETGPGRFSSRFWIAELGLSWAESPQRRAGRLAVGPWFYSGAVERLDGRRANSSAGFYTVFEQRLWREAPELEDDEQGLGVFLQYGFGDDEVCEIAHHLSTGMIWAGPVRGRDEDVAGIMWSFVGLSNAGAEAFDGNETTIELFYRLELSELVVLTSDIQYIAHPSGSKEIGETLVATMRLEVGFGLDDLHRMVRRDR